MELSGKSAYSVAVKAACSITLLLLVVAAPGVAQNLKRNQFLSVTFAVDGNNASCADLRVTLGFQGHEIVPDQRGNGFVVPALFQNTGRDTDKVSVGVTCGEYSLKFLDIHRSWVSAGRWTVGIAYPPYWIEHFRWTNAIEHGTWVSYLEAECDDCDPGVFTTVSHDEPPENFVASLKNEQQVPSGGRARDIAYALAVFGSEYEQNRDFLLQELNACLARPKESPENNVCDGRLLDYVTNLYWRGDSTLLQHLLRLADSRRDVIDEIGTFYADLLDRRSEPTVEELSQLTLDKQTLICELAGADEYSLDEPKLERVKQRLQGIGNETANQCFRAAEKAAKNVPWRQQQK